jgi:hypothetical protein
MSQLVHIYQHALAHACSLTHASTCAHIHSQPDISNYKASGTAHACLLGRTRQHKAAHLRAVNALIECAQAWPNCTSLVNRSTRDARPQGDTQPAHIAIASGACAHGSLNEQLQPTCALSLAQVAHAPVWPNCTLSLLYNSTTHIQKSTDNSCQLHTRLECCAPA